MNQQQNPSAGLFSTRSDGEGRSLLKPASSLARSVPSAGEAGETDWERFYTPNEPTATEEASAKVRLRRSRLVERDRLPETEAAAAADATPERFDGETAFMEQRSTERQPPVEQQPPVEHPGASQSRTERQHAVPTSGARPETESPSDQTPPYEAAYSAPPHDEHPYEYPYAESPRAEAQAAAPQSYSPQPGPAYPPDGRDHPAQPFFWTPVAPPPGGQAQSAGWPPANGQPVFVPVYFSPYVPFGDGREGPPPYAVAYAPPSDGSASPFSAQPEWPRAAVRAHEPEARYDRPAEDDREAEYAQEADRDRETDYDREAPPAPQGNAYADEEREAAPAPRRADARRPADDEEEDWQPGEGTDAVSNEQMASPVPVSLSKLDFSSPKKRRAWPWVTLVILVLLAAAAVLWKTGLYKRLPIPGLANLNLFPQAAVEATVEAPVDTAEAVRPTVTEFTVDASRAIAPADLIFYATTSTQVKQLRLMNATGLPLSAQITFDTVGDELKWKCQVSFASAYRGDVSLYLCGEDGFWFDGGQSVAIEVE